MYLLLFWADVDQIRVILLNPLFLLCCFKNNYSFLIENGPVI